MASVLSQTRFLLSALVCSVFWPCAALAATPAQRYQTAKELLTAHSADFMFLHDDSPAAIAALKDMWAASADAVVELLARRPDAAATEIKTVLCALGNPSNDCSKNDGDEQQDVLSLGPHLFAVTQSSGQAGTVFVVGLRGKKPALLWSINVTSSQGSDSRGLLCAWRAEDAGSRCRDADSGHKPGTCGPLYASLGLLPPDSAGRPRFFIDAGYAQMMGGTVGKQTSIWRWDGEQPLLLWIDFYDFMVGQAKDAVLADGILSLHEKDEFRTFGACGSCEGRQIAQQLRVTPNSLEDLGKVSLTAELDLVDELLWRLAHNRSAADIASPQVTNLIQRRVIAPAQKAKSIQDGSFYGGMLGDFAITRKGDLEHLCFTADEIGRLDFTLQRVPGKSLRLTQVAQPSGKFGACTQPDEIPAQP